VLDECAYPAVLVARAVSDGNDLSVGLRPGVARGRRSIVIADLLPEHRYDVRAVIEEFVASRDGRTILDVDLDGRVELTITPKA
jgi:hypothetical protein